jgi:phospholipase/carboxylesterase
VPTVPDTELIQFNDWTLRIRQTDHPLPRLLLMIHGFTGDENSMWVFARNLPTDYWIIAPRARQAASTSGYSWNSLQLTTEKRPSLEQLRPAAEALLHLIDAYQLSAGLEPHPEIGRAHV